MVFLVVVVFLCWLCGGVLVVFLWWCFCKDCHLKVSEVDIYAKEMSAVHETLQGDKIQPVTSKRPADSMVQETPSKKFAPAFLAE